MTEPEEQNPFEQQLTRALRRVDVRADTARKFLALAAEAELQRAAHGHGPRTLPRLVKLSNGGRVIAFPQQARHWAAAAIAAALIASVTLGGVHVEHEHERAKTQQAQREFQAAERIENQTLQLIRQQVERASGPLD